MGEFAIARGVRRRAVPVPALLVSALAAGAHAAERAGTDEVVDLVIVTASPILSDRFDILQGTSILQGEELDRRRAPTLGETLRLEPGVSSSFFGPGSSRPVIRGQGGPRVEVLRNGVGALDLSVTSVDHLVLTEPLAAETIEVVRGPATLRYGSAAAGGVVNVIDSSIPRSLFEKPLSLVWRGSYATVNDGRETAGLAQGNAGPVAVHVDGYYRNTDDFGIPDFARSAALRALDPPEPGGEEPSGVVENSFIESWGGTLGASYVYASGYLGVAGTFNDFSYGLPGAHGREEEEGGAEDGEESGPVLQGEQTRIDLGGGHTFTDGFLEAATFRLGYADYEHAELEGDAAGARFFNEEWEGRAEVTHLPSGGFGGALGFQFSLRDFAAIGEEAFAPPNVTFQWGLFAIEKFLYGRWEFSAGTRYEHTDVNGSFAEDAAAPPLPVDLAFDSVSGTLGAAFKPAEGWLTGAFGYYTQRAPSAEELLSRGPHLATGSFEVGDPGLDKEIAVGAEATVRYRNEWLSAGINVYATAYDGFIYARAADGNNDGEVDEKDGLPVFRYTAANAEFLGFEAEAEARLWRASWGELRAGTVFDYVNARDGDGGPLPRIPPLRWLAALEVRGGRIDARVEAQWVDGVSETATLELPTESFSLVNAHFNFRPLPGRDTVQIAFDATNLLDAEIRLNASFLKDEAPLPGRGFRVRAIVRY